MRQADAVGIDVSARELVVAVRRDGRVLERRRFENNVRGHGRLVGFLTRGGRQARVGLESTGVYGLELAVALDRAKGVEVMVANPRAVKDFSDALLKRTKTDPQDAEAMLEFVERMPFEAWKRPSDSALALRTIARRMASLAEAAGAEKNRLHAAGYLPLVGAVIRADIKVNLRHLERRMRKLGEQALTVVRGDEELLRKFNHLVSVKGIARRSAIRILGELEVLPRDMTARQWTAHGGLDPRQHESGSSIAKPTRISKVGNQRLRAALYMPALVAIRHEPRVRAYSERLIARGKKPLQAVTAVMRRLLCSIHAMFRLDVPFNPEKFARPLDIQESA